MAKILATVKAIITRLVFAIHGLVGIWQVTIFKKNSFYWYLSSPILLLFFEGLFTLTIKENQEWKWFCPSVFLYLASIVPAIWLLELDKVDRRLKIKEETFNLTASAGDNFKELNNLMGVQIKLPEIALSTETWITLIEQFLMLILIIGRWMLPKGDLTRDQLSQLLLVYIGTAADIIEFFDSFKDDKIASEPVLVLLTLGIWSWSLMQFTVVLTATKSRKSRLTTTGSSSKDENKKKRAKGKRFELTNISIISKGDMYSMKKKKHEQKQRKVTDQSEESDAFSENEIKQKKPKMKNYRKDTGYSTGSSHSSNHHRQKHSVKPSTRRDSTKNRSGKQSENKFSDSRSKKISTLSEESDSDISRPVTPVKKHKVRNAGNKFGSRPTLALSTSHSSSG